MMKKTTKKLAVGTAIAAAAGYVAGILTAPKSGKETRKDIQDSAIKAKTEAEKRLKILHSELHGLIETGKQNAQKLQGSAKTQLTTVLTGAQRAREKAREILSAIHEGDASDKDLQKVIRDVNEAIEHLKKYLKKNEEKPSENSK